MNLSDKNPKNFSCRVRGDCVPSSRGQSSTVLSLALALLALLGLCGLLLIRFHDGRETAKREGVLLDTVVSLEITGEGDMDGILDGAFSLIGEMDGKFSMYKSDSAVSAINAAAGGAPVKTDRDVFALIQTAREIASLSDGAFDPTIGPVTALWGIGDPARAPSDLPERAKIEAALALVGYDGIELTESNETVRLSAEGAMLDLGGVAKGYVSQRVAEYLRAAGVASALIDLGGNVQLVGGRPNGAPWHIGVRNPDGGEAVCSLELRDAAAITAGTYERFAEIDGALYTHIFDPRTGLPVRNSLLSVTVVCRNGAEGDALSTALMVIGPSNTDAALDLLALFPGTEAVFVARGAGNALTIRATKGLEGRIKSLQPAVAVEFIGPGR